MRQRNPLGRVFILIVGALLSIQWPGSAAWAADPLQFFFTPYHMRDNVSANSIGRTPGDRLLFGANVRPNPRCCNDPATTVTASQLGSAVSLLYLDSPAVPDEFSGTVLYNSALAGAWTMTATNPGSPNSPLQALSHVVGNAAQVPFVESMTLTGTETRPTFSWVVPNGFTPDRVSIQIWNRDDPLAVGLARLVHQISLAADATSYTVAGPLNATGETLQADRRYSVAILLHEDRSPGSTLSRSVSFFDFTPTNAGQIPIALPTLDGTTGVYNFNTAVQAGQTVFLDPLVAVGYDYAIGPGNPRFASLTLPDVGDGWYRLYVFDGHAFRFVRWLGAGVVHHFPPGGVERFRVLGIEPAAGLDPANAMAFVTGVTFTDSGQFTGTMTPLTRRFETTADECQSVLVELRAEAEDVAISGPHAERYRGLLLADLDRALVLLDRQRVPLAIANLWHFDGTVWALLRRQDLSREDADSLFGATHDAISCVGSLIKSTTK
jgi:hypothetical protein